MNQLFTRMLVCCTLLSASQVSGQTTFTNNTPITTHAFGPGDPFPSTITVSGLNPYTTKVVVTLEGINIPNVVCNQVYLESPTGQVVCLFSKSGSAFYTLTGDLTFDQDSPNQPPEPYAAPFTPGTYHPYISNAQALPANTTARLDSFNTYNPNGTWKLYENGIIGLTDVGSINSWQLTITSTNVPLPLSLVSFDVFRKGSQSDLTWTTTEEHNTSLFVIERSRDGKSFEPIGQVKATGSTTIRTTYHYTDVSPVEGANYYRLKMEDRDGGYQYSTVAVLSFSSANLVLYPNPFKDKLVIERSGVSDAREVILFNVAGIRVLSQPLGEGNDPLVLDVSHLPAGIYLASLGPHTMRIIKE